LIQTQKNARVQNRIIQLTTTSTGHAVNRFMLLVRSCKKVK